MQTDDRDTKLAASLAEVSNTAMTRKVVGALVAVSPALGYAIAWFHEWGYAQYFGYPTDLIHVDLRTLLSFWSVTVFGGLGLTVSLVLVTYIVPCVSSENSAPPSSGNSGTRDHQG